MILVGSHHLLNVHWVSMWGRGWRGKDGKEGKGEIEGDKYMPHNGKIITLDTLSLL